MTPTLLRLVRYVAQYHPSLPSADYTLSGFYSPQWRQHGAVLYYRLPNGGPIIYTCKRGHEHFDLSGIDLRLELTK